MKFFDKIKKHNKSYSLGYYITPEEAFEVYKTAKEKHIKEIAEEWKNLISNKVYEILITYKIQ